MPHRATLGWMLGRIPAVITPALRYDPSVAGQILRKLERVLHQRCLGRAISMSMYGEEPTEVWKKCR